MKEGIKWHMCQTTTVSWSDGCDGGSSSVTKQISGPHGPDQIKSFGEVGDYQVCPASHNNWSMSPPTPKCSGSCYPAPNLKSLSDSDLLPKNVSEGSKYKLPINFGWEDNVEKEVAKAPNFCTVGSYEFNIVDPFLSQIVTNRQLQNIEDPAYKLECQLKPDDEYQWKVQACLDSGGADCGEWSEDQSFNTSLAPELITPYDFDWAGEKATENVSPPATLDWCDVEEAESYRFKVYVIEEEEKICHPRLLSIKRGEEICDSWLLRKTRRNPGQAERILYSDFLDENMNFFTKDTEYAWQVVICDENGFDCKDYSQLWMFATKEMPLATSFLVAPMDDPTGKKPVGLPLVIDWNDKPGVNSFIYEIASMSGSQQISENTKVSQSKQLNYPELSLNTLYKWKVKSCWDYEAEKCEPKFSEEWYFKTTGQPPQLTHPAPDEQRVVIPVNFKWEDVPGAESYILKVSGGELNLEEILDKPEFSLDYPDVKMLTNYSWQVKTCAWEKGKGACGQYSALRDFKTFRLPPPQNPFPKNKGQLFTDEKYASWQEVPGAKAYQYKMVYLSLAEEETDKACFSLVGQEVVQQKTVGSQNDFLPLICLGEYQWQARSCLDKNCQETSDWSNSWSFSFLQPSDRTIVGGLVPCGKTVNNPETPWNEREPCQIKHIFLLIKVIIDFLLFRAAPIILVLLALTTGVMFYFSMSTGETTPIIRVRRLWKSTGIGLGIIFFAWTIVNIALKLIGYQVGIFGNWYQIPL